MEQAEISGRRDTWQTSGLAGRVRERANAQLTQQKDRATDGLGSVAQAVRQSTQQLRNQRHETIAQYVEQAADRLEKLSMRLKDKNVSEILDDAQRFARQRPALFIGSAFAIGLLGARFLKSSSPEYGGASKYAVDTPSVPSRAYVTSDVPPSTPYPGTEIR
jgi:ElaB/YqjD/DUF883 family membrane-anchored ribosome-binding protein